MRVLYRFPIIMDCPRKDFPIVTINFAVQVSGSKSIDEFWIFTSKENRVGKFPSNLERALKAEGLNQHQFLDADTSFLSGSYFHMVEKFGVGVFLVNSIAKETLFIEPERQHFFLAMETVQDLLTDADHAPYIIKIGRSC